MQVALLKKLVKVRRHIRAQLNPAAEQLIQFGATQSQLVALGVLMALGSGLCIVLFSESRWTLLLIPITMVCQGLLSAISGQMRQIQAIESAPDRLLQLLCKTAGEVALYLPLGAVSGVCPYLMTLAVVLTLFAELTGAGAVLAGSSRREDGPMRRRERMVVFACLGTVLGLGLPTGRWLDIVLGVIDILLGITIVIRFRRATDSVTSG